jgi:Anthrone oxygenase
MVWPVLPGLGAQARSLDQMSVTRRPGLLPDRLVLFTLIVIMLTNKKLLDPELDRASEVAHQLLQDWGKLHAVRNILALGASVVFLSSVIWRQISRPTGKFNWLD